MFRKTILTSVAVAAIAAAALMPTTASARHGGHGGAHAVAHGGGHAVARGAFRVGGVRHFSHVRFVRHRHFVVRHVRPIYASCVVRRVVATAAGPRVRLINRCRPHIYALRHY